MDWIEAKMDQVRIYLKNIPFRRAMIGYMAIMTIAAAVLAAITMMLCRRWELLIWQEYPQWDTSQAAEVLAAGDETAVKLLQFVQQWCAIIYMFGGILITVCVFYKNRLNVPFSILKMGTEEIRHNNLDFPMYYDSKDELGQLCLSFENMRQELIRNKEEMYKLIDSQKNLNAAFAHDLRTPLTVLKGYSDFLARFLPAGKISEQKMLETLKLMSSHIERLEQYSRTMKGIRSIEEITVCPEQIAVGQVDREIGEVIFALNQIGDISIEYRQNESDTAENMLYADKNIIMEVLENLLSNAIRYATSEIVVSPYYSRQNEELVLTVWDDGPGFSKQDLKQAVLPYYREHGDTQDEHFGIGLHICRLLCNKHGGTLSIANSIHDGAVVTVSFGNICNGIS